jgi:hypothetical protein
VFPLPDPESLMCDIEGLLFSAGFLLSFGRTVEQNRLWSRSKVISGFHDRFLKT